MSTDVRRQRLQALNNQIDRLSRYLYDLLQRSDRLSRWRLGSFAFIFVLGSVIFVTWGAALWIISSLILLIPFILTVHWHRNIEDSISRHQLLLDLKKAQKARMTLDWDHIPFTGPYSIVENHPFAVDLNLVGSRSLLRLLDVSITK